MGSGLSRRGFLAGSASFVVALAALQARRAIGAPRRSRSVDGPYGPLRPTRDLSTGLPLVLLPEGFEYRSYSWTGDPMSNGDPTPDAHDGMAVVATRGKGETLWSGTASTHTARNVGTTTLRLVEIEVKRARAADESG